MLQKHSSPAQVEAAAPHQEARSWPGKRTRTGGGAAATTAGHAAARSKGAAAVGGATRMEDWPADSMMGAMGLNGGATPAAVEPDASRESHESHESGESGETDEATRSAGGVAQGLIVASSAEPAPGQLTQLAFLAQLRGAVTRTASQVLGPTWLAANCPDIPKLFAHYAALDADACERVVSRYARLAAPSSAVEYIAPICARLMGAIARWGGGEELSWELGSSGVPLAAEEGARGKPKDAGERAGEGGGEGARSAPPSSAPSASSSPSAPLAVQLKRAEGAAGSPDASVSPDELGAGAPMERGVASRMGAAFGTSFDHVRVHTGPEAGEKTRALGADALALGSHVAFAPGQYQPGTPSGDGLIAHELAHVMQQRGGDPLVQQRSYAVQASDAYEHDADDAAAAVVARLHGGEAASGPAADPAPIRPALASGLGVRRGNRPTVESMGQHMISHMDQANSPSGGVHYWEGAKAKMEQAGGRWIQQYDMGHHFTSWTDPTSKFFYQPHEVRRPMWFVLKPQQSASAAIKAWLAGPTIAECLTIVLAMQLDALRASIGDELFDKQFGSVDPIHDAAVRKAQRQLKICPQRDKCPDNEKPSIMPFLEETKFTEKNKHQPPGMVDPDDQAMFELGEMYHIANHCRYKSKHPGGDWQGVNVIYVGTNHAGIPLWSGLGVNRQTEAEVLAMMRVEYDAPRTGYDREVMVNNGILRRDPGGAETVQGVTYRYADADFDPASFPATTTIADIKATGGGLVPHTGKRFKLSKVQQLMEPEQR